MNILVVAYSVDKNDISESQMAYEWISRLSQHATLWVVTTGSRVHDTCGLENMPNVHLRRVQPRISFKWFDSFDRAVHPSYVEFYFRAKKVIQQILADNAIDFCHHLSPQSTRFPSPLHDCGKPYIIGPIHGGLHPPPVMNELNGKEGALFLLRKFDRVRNRWDYLLKKTYSNAVTTVVSAPYVSETPPTSYCPKRAVIPGTAVAVPVRFREHGDNGGPVRFIYGGRLVPSKGVELLIEAFAICTAKNVVLSIYGCGGSEAYYKELAKKRGVDERLHWGGFIPQEQLLEEFYDSDVFVFPSLKEPMGIVVMEAMAAGLPVICVDSGGPGYIVAERAGVKVPLGSKDEMVSNIAAAIDLVADDVTVRREMGLFARQRVISEFTWERVVEKMVSVYQGLL